MIVAEDWIPEFLRPQIDEVLDRGWFPYSRSLVWLLSNCFRQHKASKLNCVSVNSLEMRRADMTNATVIIFSCIREALERDRFWQETVFGTLGYVENQPVSTAITFLINDEFHLGWAATLPDYRNHAEAVIRHSREQQRNVMAKKTLAAHNSCWLSVYQRIGYQPTAYFRTYTYYT